MSGTGISYPLGKDGVGISLSSNWRSSRRRRWRVSKGLARLSEKLELYEFRWDGRPGRGVEDAMAPSANMNEASECAR